MSAPCQARAHTEAHYTVRFRNRLHPRIYFDMALIVASGETEALHTASVYAGEFVVVSQWAPLIVSTHPIIDCEVVYGA